MGELWLLRHAEPVSAGLYIGRGSDVSLSPRGKIDADLIAVELADSEKKPEIIYCSPLKRAIETVKPLSDVLGLEIEICEGLAEIDFGDWEGRSWKDIQAGDGELWQTWLDNPWTTAPPGGETLEDLQDRVIYELEGILEHHGTRRILIASHGGPIRTILGYALGLDASAWWSVAIDYASVSRFMHRKYRILELLQWNVPIKTSTNTESLIITT